MLPTPASPGSSRVTIHMAASLDGFIARRNGGVDWLETADEYAKGEDLDPRIADELLGSVDVWVMGARTYETAIGFEAQGLGWPYGETPLVVLTHRELQRRRATTELWAGDLAELLEGDLRRRFRDIWLVGGGRVAGECLRRGLADEIRWAIAPIAIGDGIPFFDRLERDVPLHLADVRAYRSGVVELRYEIRRRPEPG